LDSWLIEQRGWLVIGLAVSAVVLPLLLGVLFGHIPLRIFIGSALPFGAATVLLAMGVQALSNHVDPWNKLVISLLFGFLWGGLGMQILRIEQRHGGGPPQAVHARRGIGYTFILFALLWTVISIWKFW
jgi:hypothetical protein